MADKRAVNRDETKILDMTLCQQNAVEWVSRERFGIDCGHRVMFVDRDDF